MLFLTLPWRTETCLPAEINRPLPGAAAAVRGNTRSPAIAVICGWLYRRVQETEPMQRLALVLALLCAPIKP
jgi:hypothetical protein